MAFSFSDYAFELEISENDKTNAINEIKASKNFKLSGTKVIDYLYSDEVDRYEGEKSTSPSPGSFGDMKSSG